MRFKIILPLLLAATVTGLAISCTGSSAEKRNETVQPDSSQLVIRGEYLVSSIGCDDCHSPKKMGPMGPEVIPELRLSGYPADRPLLPADSNVVKQGWALFNPDLTSAVGPWGISFASNLTSEETGLGNWTEKQFFTAIRKGKYKGHESGRQLLPPMPWFVYKNLTDEDLRSVFYYLQTIPAVENLVPGPKSFAEIN
jgi:hypothetical protein